MVDASKVSWGGYSRYEGPLYFGRHRWQLPSDHDFLDEAFYVTQAAEGCMDACQGYDAGIISVGAIQWIDAYPQLSVTKMLGEVAEKHSGGEAFVRSKLALGLALANAEFHKNSSGNWRFFIGTKQVASKVEQHALYHGGSSGQKGDWTSKQRLHAKTWVACVSSVFEDAEARDIQASFTKSRLMSFVQAAPRNILFGKEDDQAHAGFVSALRASYISFAVNNPTWAAYAVGKCANETKYDKWSRGYLVDMLRSLVYAKGIRIYPTRYESIRPKLEELYGIVLPHSAAELKKTVYRDSTNGALVDAVDMQRVLNGLDFDCGTVDGNPGKKTWAALNAFRASIGLPPAENIDELTLQKLVEAHESKSDETKDTSEAPPASCPSLAPVPDGADNSVDVKNDIEDSVESTTQDAPIQEAHIENEASEQSQEEQAQVTGWLAYLVTVLKFIFAWLANLKKPSQ